MRAATGASVTPGGLGCPVPDARPRVLFVGTGDFDLPLSPALAKKWDAISEEFDVRSISPAGVVRSTDPRFRLVRQAPPPFGHLIYFASLPAIVAVELRRFRPDVIVTTGPYEAFMLLPAWKLVRPRSKLLIQLHGDWRTAARLYGSPLRRLYAGISDRAAEFALRQASGVRALSEFTESLALEVTGRSPLSVFPAYLDLETFVQEPPRPLPDRPSIVWIGVLQKSKNPRLLADAWRLVAGRTSAARLVVVGQGPERPIIDELVRDFPTRATSLASLTPAEVARLLDDSTALVMSSESEGLPRVVMEAFTRGRPVVATAVGGIPDLVRTGRNGILVPRGDVQGLADAVVRILEDRALAERLSRGALQDAEQLRRMPADFSSAFRQFVETALSG
jgi:glycosyltransferase involved in cell wall biosynthesis